MVINKDGLITENQNTPADVQIENTVLNNTIDPINSTEPDKDFDLKGNNQIIANFIDEDTPQSNNELENISVTLDEEEILEKLDASSSLEDKKETVETNCLALTVRKDYNFAIARNTVFKTIRMSIKVAISTIVLNLIKLFF